VLKWALVFDSLDFASSNAHVANSFGALASFKGEIGCRRVSWGHHSTSPTTFSRNPKYNALSLGPWIYLPRKNDLFRLEIVPPIANLVKLRGDHQVDFLKVILFRILVLAVDEV